MLVIPGLHELRLYSLQDQMYHPERSSKADGPAPFQSAEGLSLGVRPDDPLRARSGEGLRRSRRTCRPT
jgi:hypothetical protein